ncbi:MAG TPA: hypothetical protein VKC53_02995 [Patescibacteria group bacterium]|nr:hypothetical protein [Patescibacteria group bacterium]
MAIDQQTSALKSILEEAQAVKEAIQTASEASKNGGRKVMAQTVKVDNQQYFIVDDGSTSRIVSA